MYKYSQWISISENIRNGNIRCKNFLLIQKKIIYSDEIEKRVDFWTKLIEKQED
jgi:hypothetical protein